MKIIFMLFIINGFISNAIISQVPITWDQLATATWEEKVDTNGLVSLSANFGAELEKLNEQEVIISGYVIPLDAMGFSYALSANSFAACFFCGQAGPETVMELKVTPKSVNSYDQKTELLTFRGTLILKESNPLGLNYILQGAKRVNK